jgi:hypothetical protein
LSYILVGELPLSIIKMKTKGVNVYLNGNTGFTLPLNMGELGNIETLDLSNCSLTGLCGDDILSNARAVNQFTSSPLFAGLT